MVVIGPNDIVLRALDDTLIEHRVGHLDKAGDIGALDVVREVAITSVSYASRVNVLHYLLEAAVDLLARPVLVQRVLGHLEARNGDAACIRGLAGTVKDLGR